MGITGGIAPEFMVKDIYEFPTITDFRGYFVYVSPHVLGTATIWGGTTTLEIVPYLIPMYDRRVHLCMDEITLVTARNYHHHFSAWGCYYNDIKRPNIIIPAFGTLNTRGEGEVWAMIFPSPVKMNRIYPTVSRSECYSNDLSIGVSWHNPSVDLGTLIPAGSGHLAYTAAFHGNCYRSINVQVSPNNVDWYSIWYTYWHGYTTNLVYEFRNATIASIPAFRWWRAICWTATGAGTTWCDFNKFVAI